MSDNAAPFQPFETDLDRDAALKVLLQGVAVDDLNEDDISITVLSETALDAVIDGAIAG